MGLAGVNCCRYRLGPSYLALACTRASNETYGLSSVKLALFIIPITKYEFVRATTEEAGIGAREDDEAARQHDTYGAAVVVNSTCRERAGDSDKLGVATSFLAGVFEAEG